MSAISPKPVQDRFAARFSFTLPAGRETSGISALAVAITAVSLTAGPAPKAHAQVPAGTVLEEVVVTATRREERVQDVPASVSVVTGANLEAQGITDFADVKRVASGLYLESPQGQASSSIRIRGVGSAGFSSVDPSVGVLVDGLYQPRIGSVFTDLLDVERITVLRGPQGTLFGKNTTAGAILVTTTQPDFDGISGQLQGVAGNLDNQELRGVVNAPIIDDVLAVRVAGFYAQRDGYMQNRFLGNDSRNLDRRGGRAKLRFAPTDALDMTYTLDYSDTQYRSDQGLVRYGTLDSARAGDLSGAPLEDVGEALGKPLPSIGPFTREVFQGEQRAQDEIERHLFNLKWSFLGHTLTSITGYEQVDNFLPADNDGTFLDLVQITSSPSTKTKTQEFQLANDGGGMLEYVVGLWYQDSDLQSPTRVADPADLAALEGRPQRPDTIVDSTANSETLAYFGSLTVNLDERWSLIGGLRFTDNEKTSNQTIASFPVIDNASRTDSEWTYKASVRFAATDDIMAYASYDRGFKSGGFNRQETLCFIVGAPFCLPDDRLSYEPETTDSIEAGIKADLAGGIARVNAAVFYQTYDDYQVTSKFPPSSTIVQNAADVESYGLEVDLTAAPTEQLTINGSYSYIDASYGTFDNAPCPLNESKAPTCSQDLSGRILDNSPKHTFNIGAEYRDNLSSSIALEYFIRADASYRSEANLTSTLASDTVQDGYTLLDGRIGIESAAGTWTLTLWGRNLADEEYLLIAGRPSGHVDGLTEVQGLPRTYGLTVDWRF